MSLRELYTSFPQHAALNFFVLTTPPQQIFNAELYASVPQHSAKNGFDLTRPPQQIFRRELYASVPQHAELNGFDLTTPSQQTFHRELYASFPQHFAKNRFDLMTPPQQIFRFGLYISSPQTASLVSLLALTLASWSCGLEPRRKRSRMHFKPSNCPWIVCWTGCLGLSGNRPLKICSKTVKPCDILNKTVWHDVKSPCSRKLHRIDTYSWLVNLYCSFHVFETFSSHNNFCFSLPANL